jgi:hypothetical protein
MNRNQSMLYYGFKKQLPKSKIYFIHNPRTGGKYIKKSNLLQDTRFQWYGKLEKLILGNKIDEHPCALVNPVVFDKSFRNQSETFIHDPNFLDPKSLVFSCIRNPFDRYVSAFLEAKKDFKEYKDCSFKKFIIEVCDPDYSPDPNFPFSFELSRKFSPYQVFSDAGFCVAQVLIRKELLNETLTKIAKDMNINFKPCGSSDAPPGPWGLARVQRGGSVNRDYRTYYDNETVDIVSKRRSKELKTFAYDFENNFDYNLIGNDNGWGPGCIDSSKIRYDHKEDRVYFKNIDWDTIDKWFVAGAKKDKEAHWWREKELKGQKVD